VRDALAQIEPTATAANLGLATDLPPRLLVEGDRKRLRQVVDHLLDNALKYTPDGGRISVELATEGQLAQLRIRDTGIGIPSEAREQLFTHLYRSPYARDRRIPGSGLGLVISRAIVERHGGTIVLEATDGPGTCIVVRLPLRFAVAAPALRTT